MGPIGMQEMMLVFVLALLLFGPKKLPELGRMLGKGLSEFRRAKSELKSTFEGHLRELERETRIEDLNYSSNNSTHSSSSSSSTPDYSSNYPYSYDEYGQYENNVTAGSGETTVSTSSSSSEAPSTPEQTHSESPAPASHEHTAGSHAPVPDTVPRSSGTHPVQSAGVGTREDHPA